MRIKKQHVALALALVAGLSYAYSLSIDRREHMNANVAGIVTALAKDVTGGEYEMFLKFDTIAGDSTDTKHRAEIVVDSFAWNQNRAMTAGRPTMNGFTVTMPYNAASPKMFLYGASGTKLPRVVLSVRQHGAGQDFLKWTLTQAQIVSYQTVGNTHGDGVEDQITLTFAKIEADYHPSLPDGTLGEAVHTGWDQRANALAN